MKNRLTMVFVVVLVMTAILNRPAPAQNADYLWLDHFKNWAAFFGKHQRLAEQCTGQSHEAMRSDVFAYIDKLYPDNADELKAQYDTVYSGSAARGGRGGTRKCNERIYNQSKALYEERMEQLAGFRKPPKSQQEADFRVSFDVPPDDPVCVASPPGLQPTPPAGLQASLYDFGSWTAPNGGSVLGSASLKLEADRDGTVHGWLNVGAQSDRFKVYADSTAVVVFVNSKGQRIWNPTGYQGVSAYVSQLASSADNYPDRRQGRAIIMYEPECDAAYALMKFRFCGMQGGYDRRNEADSCPGQYGGPDRGGRTLRSVDLSDIDAVLDELTRSRFSIGEAFKIGGWQGVRVR